MNKSILLGGLMAALACGPAGAAASDKAAPAVPAQAGVLSGKVVETMNAATYTYVLVETGTAKAWAAARSSPSRSATRSWWPMRCR